MKKQLSKDSNRKTIATRNPFNEKLPSGNASPNDDFNTFIKFFSHVVQPIEPTGEYLGGGA